MTDNTTDTIKAPPPSGRFPRNPERDANGEAVLYPGQVKLEGVAGCFNIDGDECVVLAPDLEGLKRAAERIGIEHELIAELCRVIVIERIK